MDWVYCNMKMGITIKGTLEMVRKMVKVNLNMQHLGIHIQEHFEKIREQDRE